MQAMSIIGDDQGREINKPAFANTVTVCQGRYSQLEAASSQSRLRYDRIQVIRLLCTFLVASTVMWVKCSRYFTGYCVTDPACSVIGGLCRSLPLRVCAGYTAH